MWSALTSTAPLARATTAMHRSTRLHSVLTRPLVPRKPTPSSALVRSTLHSLHHRSLVTDSGLMAKLKTSMHEDPVVWWLFGCAGLVTGTVTVGAASRLTRSGVSMLYWVPDGPFPPRSEEDWHHEFALYHDFSQRHQRIPMTYEEFRSNFKYSYLHRILGQVTTLAFLGPLGYFYVKERLPKSIHPLLAGVLALGATQMYVGRRSAQTMLEQHRHRDPEKEVNYYAPHGLTYETGFSMAKLALLLWAGFHLVSPPTRAIKVRVMTMSHALKNIGELRKYVQYATLLFAGTAAAGTIVAGIDAGKEFNTFPKMGDKWIPDGLFERKPWLRNFYENVALVQLDHRILAVSTLTAYGFVYTKFRKPHIWDNLPPESKKALNWMMVAVGGQVAGGVTMLVNAVPTTLAMVHTSGAAAILGTSLWTLYTLRFARPVNAIAVAKTISKVL